MKQLTRSQLNFIFETLEKELFFAANNDGQGTPLTEQIRYLVQSEKEKIVNGEIDSANPKRDIKIADAILAKLPEYQREEAVQKRVSIYPADPSWDKFVENLPANDVLGFRGEIDDWFRGWKIGGGDSDVWYELDDVKTDNPKEFAQAAYQKIFVVAGGKMETECLLKPAIEDSLNQLNYSWDAAKSIWHLESATPVKEELQ